MPSAEQATDSQPFLGLGALVKVTNVKAMAEFKNKNAPKQIAPITKGVRIPLMFVIGQVVTLELIRARTLNFWPGLST